MSGEEGGGVRGDEGVRRSKSGGEVSGINKGSDKRVGGVGEVSEGKVRESVSK